MSFQGAARRLLPLLLGLLAPAGAADAAEITAAERARIVALGPWPPKFERDPTNRVSGQPRAIALGRSLFFDPRMSPIGYIACVSCHAPDRAFADLKPRAHGLADLERNTPALINLRLQRWYGWSGASDSLWMASLRPILEAGEFDGSAASVVRLFRRDDDLARCYRQVFGVTPFGDDERTLVNVGKALAAYVETLRTGRTPFDDFRDALARGAPAASYPPAALRGLRLFVGRAGCVACHLGPAFSDGRFHDVGAPPPIAPMRTDPGRAEGAQRLLTSRYNLLGRYNDDPKRATATPDGYRDLVRADGLNARAFRTPGLRNVAVTAPYMHNGRVETLADAVRQHAADAPGRDPANAAAAALAEHEVADLVAFLHTLTDAQGERRDPAVLASCP